MTLQNVYEPDPAIQDELVELLYKLLTPTPHAGDHLATESHPSKSVISQQLQ